MKKNSKQITIFEGRKMRRFWDEKQEKWYFPVVDIIQALIQQIDYQIARKYWNKLKERLKKEGNESVSNCHQLKFEAADGKIYLTDAADVETLLRLLAKSRKQNRFKGLRKIKFRRIKAGESPNTRGWS